MGATAIQARAEALEHVLRERRPANEIHPLLADLEAPLTELIAALEARLPPDAARTNDKKEATHA